MGVVGPLEQCRHAEIQSLTDDYRRSIGRGLAAEALGTTTLINTLPKR